MNVSQVCSIEMDVETGDQDTVNLLPANMTLKQSKDMTQFSITECVLVNATHPNTGIQMRIKMKRKITSEMMTTYFPSLLLMMITYATTFFKPFFFEAALSVNLTTMLVMTTIFISKMEGLPPTSATKMIDYWLILCQLVPFAQVVLLTAKEYFREEEQDKEERKENCQGAIAQSEMDDEGVNGPETTETRKAIPRKNTRPIVPMLTVIGKLHFSAHNLTNNDPF